MYILAAHAKDLGSDFIPVHIFPVNFKDEHSVAYLNKFLIGFSENTAFEKNMRNAFNYFEKYRQVPPVLIGDKGDYITEEVSAPEEIKPEPKIKKKKPHQPQPIPDEELAKSVDRLPVYPGGNKGFQAFIDKLSRDMFKELDEGQRKTFVMVEYIIDSSGKSVYAKVLRGGNDVMNEKIESAFLNMPQWEPAKRLGLDIGIKLKQTIMVGTD